MNVNIDLGRYFHRPAEEIVVLERTRIPDDDMPVVMFLAERARVSATVIWSHRQGGMHWADIATRYGLGADIFYVALSINPGPPYGRAYGHYRRVPRSHWHTIRLEDADIVNLVNLRFLSDYYGYPPERIVVWRSEGAPFVRIHDVADREGWKAWKEREKDRREAAREWGKDRREAWKEREKDEREARKESGRDRRETWKERNKR